MPDIYEAHQIVITWTVGDSIVIEQGELGDWEVRAALEQAIEILSEDESHEADVAGD